MKTNFTNHLKCCYLPDCCDVECRSLDKSIKKSCSRIREMRIKSSVSIHRRENMSYTFLRSQLRHDASHTTECFLGCFLGCFSSSSRISWPICTYACRLRYAHKKRRIFSVLTVEASPNAQLRKQSTPTPLSISNPLVGEWTYDKHERFDYCLPSQFTFWRFSTVG